MDNQDNPVIQDPRDQEAQVVHQVYKDPQDLRDQMDL